MDEITQMIDNIEEALLDANSKHHKNVKDAIEHETSILYCCYSIDLAIEKLTNTVTKGTIERIKSLESNLKIKEFVDDKTILKEIYGYD